MAEPRMMTLRDTSVDNSNQVVLARSGRIEHFLLTNGGTVDAWFHLYDALTADVSVGSTTPKASFVVPAGTSATVVGAYEYNGPPIYFEKGIVYACSTTPTGGTDCTTKPTLGILSYTG